MNDLRCFVGLDLGQTQDYTALAVLERHERPGDRDPVYFARRKHIELHLRHVERFPLRTPSPTRSLASAT